jgi:hypothetical protein
MRIRKIVGLFGLALMAGFLSACGSGPLSLLSSGLNSISGNWEMHSSSAQAAALPELAGSFATSNGTVTAVFHTLATNACLSSSNFVEAGGTMDAKGNVKMTSANFNGSVLTMSGVLAADGKSLTNAAYSVAGGSCGFPVVAGTAAAPMTATQYAAISGSYAGTFTDSDGDSIPVTGAFTQSTAPDANGVYHLSGNANFPGNPCLTSPAIVDSTVSGNMLSTTYSQTTNGVTNTVVANGTFSADASTLTVTGWTLTGGCGTETGTGIFTKQ